MPLLKALAYEQNSHLKELDTQRSPPSLHPGNDSVTSPANLVMSYTDYLFRNCSYLQKQHTATNSNEQCGVLICNFSSVTKVPNTQINMYMVTSRIICSGVTQTLHDGNHRSNATTTYAQMGQNKTYGSQLIAARTSWLLGGPDRMWTTTRASIAAVVFPSS